MKPKAILFDMDGVLIDSHGAWLDRFNAALENFGFKKIHAEEFDRHIWAINFAETVNKYFPGKTIDEVRKIKNHQSIDWWYDKCSVS